MSDSDTVQRKKPSISFSGDVQILGNEHESDEQEANDISKNGSSTNNGSPSSGGRTRLEGADKKKNNSGTLENDGYFSAKHYNFHPDEKSKTKKSPSPHGKESPNKNDGNSPGRTPSGTYAPARTPSVGGGGSSSSTSSGAGTTGSTSSAGTTKSALKKTSTSTASTNTLLQMAEERKRESQEKYQAQEQIYVRQITKNMFNDYYHTPVAEDLDQIKTDSDADDDEDEDAIDGVDSTQPEAIGLGGVGTSFDDEYTDLGSSYPFLEMGGGSSLDDLATDESLKERLEWQAMLSSVLTGEVVRSEKRRIRGPQNSKILQDDDLWIGLRAKVCGRTVQEQKRVVDYSRSNIGEVFDEFWNFKIHYDSDSTLETTTEQVKHILKRVEKIEALWKSLQAMRTECKPYGDELFQRRLGALISWDTITAAITQEFELLREWTGNAEIDPTVAPPKTADMEDPPSLVESILKQDKLESIFDKRIQRTMGPLIQKARDATVEYSEVYVELGLPLFHERLSHLLQFPIKMIEEVIRLRLIYARRLVNPTMMIVDQMIVDLGKYIKLAVEIMKRNREYASPIFDKGWVFPNHTDDKFNSTVLDCLGHYLELLQTKFLSDSNNKSSSSSSLNKMYLSFKETDQLEQQYTFLRDVGGMVKGADLLIAEQFSTLETRMLHRLYNYWERQMKGPKNWTVVEVERWFATTMENVRSFQRKLLRFYKLLCSTYENSVEYKIQTNKVKNFVESLRQSGHFLVYTGSFEKYGIYTVADPSLASQPSRIRSIFQGFCRRESPTPNSTAPSSSSSSSSASGQRGPTVTIQEEGGDHLSYLLIFCIQEPLVWEGEITNLDMPYFEIDLHPGRLRLVTEGYGTDLKHTREQLADITGAEDVFDVMIEARSHITKTNHELGRIRRMFFRLAMSVINSALSFRSMCRQRSCLNKEQGCQETVQNMFVFAREFGQRGIQIMDATRKGNVAMKLINMSIEWVTFICDDCVPTDYKTFRWTVVALEFAMVMTRGVNITAIDNSQFAKLRLKVAGCMTLLISHFDIMGARSKAAERQKNLETARRNKMLKVQYKDDDELMKMFREEALKKIGSLEEARQYQHVVGRVLDDTNTDSEFLTFLATSFSQMSIRWQQGRFIGGGSFGSVYAAVNLDTGGVMAVKEIRLQDTMHLRRGLKSIKDEMTALEILSHPNIVQYYGVEVHRDKVFIFMEYCQGGSLAALLEYGRIEDETVIQVYTLQMLEGLAYLHQSGIVHRDIKPENVLLDHMGVIKFVDFGGAKVIAKTGKTRGDGRNSTRLNSMTGTPMYMSPEVITGSDPGRHGSIDIWSTGCCVLEMATGRRPWANLDNDWAVMYHIAAGHLPQLPSADQLSDEGIEFLMKCLQRDPVQRQSAVELLRDPWILAISKELIGDPSSDDISPSPTALASPSAASSSSTTSSSVPSRDLSQVQAAARSITYSYSSQVAADAASAASAAAAAGTSPTTPPYPYSSSAAFPVPKQAHVKSPGSVLEQSGEVKPPVESEQEQEQRQQQEQL